MNNEVSGYTSPLPVDWGRYGSQTGDSVFDLRGHVIDWRHYPVYGIFHQLTPGPVQHCIEVGTQLSLERRPFLFMLNGLPAGHPDRYQYAWEAADGQ